MKKSCIVFIPGFKGSALSRTDGSGRLWVTIPEILFGKKSLKLPHEQNANDNQLSHLAEDGILDAITVVPGIFQIDIYKSFLDFFKSHLPDIPIIPFSYDWRKDIIDSVQQLSQLVEDLKKKYSITIVAHSLGGLITAYYLRYGALQPEQAIENWEGVKTINSVVFAGVPFKGIAQIFVEMQTGSPVAMNKVLLSSEAISSFPSAYQMLPSPGTDFFFDEDKMKSQIYSVKTWLKYRWGCFNRKDLVPDDIEHYSEFLDSQLQRASLIHELLQAPSQKDPKNNLRILNCFGYGHKTIDNIDVSESKGGSFVPVFCDGDGTVSKDSAELLEAFKKTVC